MGTLASFLAYLDERRTVITGIEMVLSGLQEKYETYFAEINRVREGELQQLTALIVDDKSDVPAELKEALDQAHASASATFDEEFERLARSHAETIEEAEQVRGTSKEDEDRVRQRNTELDSTEEQLKTRNRTLLDQITEFNRRIRSMGKGFGFFSNLFRMRRLAAERRALQQQQEEISLRIEALRNRWVADEKAFVDEEAERSKAWIALQTKGGALKTKLEYLNGAKARITLRSALEQVLFETIKEPIQPSADDPKCPRCEQPNAETNHFCHICAQRLNDDRLDFAGSFAEIGELNHHHHRFSEGMRACQEFIGLVRGLGSGFDAFMLSVKDVQLSESKYPLPVLQIDVPQASLTYGAFFDGLRASMQRDYAVHPTVFAQGVEQMIGDVFTEDKIKDFFEGMGQELSTQADAQW